MGAIDNARRHFDAIGVRKIEVPEWGDEPDKPLVIYFNPFTLAEKQKLAEVGEREGFIARLADAMIMKAMDAEGKKLFTIDDKRVLRTKVEPDVIARVVAEMMRTPTVEEMEKNSSRTPS